MASTSAAQQPQASTSAASSSAAPDSAGPSQDAIASLITQVSPTGQPARAPARPAKPRQKKKPTVSKPAAGAASTTSSAAPTASTSTPSAASSASAADRRRTDHDVQSSNGTTGTAGSATLVDAPVASTSTAKASATPKPAAAATKSAPQARSASGAGTKKAKKPSFVKKLLIAFGCASPAVAAATFAEKDKPADEKTGRADRDLKSTSATSAMTGDPSKETLPDSSSAPAVAVVPATSSVEMAANQSRAGATLSRDETGDVLSGAVVPPGADGTTPPRKPSRRFDGGASGDTTLGDDDAQAAAAQPDAAGAGDEVEEDEDDDFVGEEDEEDRIIAQGGMGIPIGDDGSPHPLLVPMSTADSGRKCLVLDLDETLVHSSFKMIHQADYVVPVEIENQSHNVYVIKRPGVDNFLKRMGEIYEVVVFTASLSKYADPVLDQLDVHRVVRHRLFRESCYNHRGNYVKDLSQLGRPIGETIIIDNSPASYIFHPKNAVPVSSWFNDPHDTELTDLANVLTDLATVPDVRGVLDVFLS